MKLESMLICGLNYIWYNFNSTQNTSGIHHHDVLWCLENRIYISYLNRSFRHWVDQYLPSGSNAVWCDDIWPYYIFLGDNVVLTCPGEHSLRWDTKCWNPFIAVHCMENLNIYYDCQNVYPLKLVRYLNYNCMRPSWPHTHCAA